LGSQVVDLALYQIANCDRISERGASSGVVSEPTFRTASFSQVFA
jgi:hypothetical protein